MDYPASRRTPLFWVSGVRIWVLIFNVFRAHADVQEPNLSMNVLAESVFLLGNFSSDQPEVRNRTWPFLPTLMGSGSTVPGCC